MFKTPSMTSILSRLDFGADSVAALAFVQRILPNKTALFDAASVDDYLQKIRENIDIATPEEISEYASASPQLFYNLDICLSKPESAAIILKDLRENVQRLKESVNSELQHTTASRKYSVIGSLRTQQKQPDLTLEEASKRLSALDADLQRPHLEKQIQQLGSDLHQKQLHSVLMDRTEELETSSTSMFFEDTYTMQSILSHHRAFQSISPECIEHLEAFGQLAKMPHANMATNRTAAASTSTGLSKFEKSILSTSLSAIYTDLSRELRATSKLSWNIPEAYFHRILQQCTEAQLASLLASVGLQGHELYYSGATCSPEELQKLQQNPLSQRIISVAASEYAFAIKLSSLDTSGSFRSHRNLLPNFFEDFNPERVSQLDLTSLRQKFTSTQPESGAKHEYMLIVTDGEPEKKSKVAVKSKKVR